MSRVKRPIRAARRQVRTHQKPEGIRRRFFPALAVAGLLVPVLGGASVTGLGQPDQPAEVADTAASVTVVPELPIPDEGSASEPAETGGTSEPASPAQVSVATPARVPTLLWRAYAAAVDLAPAECHLPISLLAAIGQVESGSLAGRALDAEHRAVPAVFGPVLNGNGFAAIADTDSGALDGHGDWDRAVGPMQFIPGTWARWGRDADGDGTAHPQDIEDAAASAAAYLCAGGRDLSTAEGLRAAILSYNHSTAYLALVLHWKRAFEAIPPETGAIETVSAVPEPGDGPRTSRAEAAGVPSAVVSLPPPKAPAAAPTRSSPEPGVAPPASGPSQPATPATTPPTEAPAESPAEPPGVDPTPAQVPAPEPTPKPTTQPTNKPTPDQPPKVCPTPSPEPTTEPTTTPAPTAAPTAEPTTEPTTDTEEPNGPKCCEPPADQPDGDPSASAPGAPGPCTAPGRTSPDTP